LVGRVEPMPSNSSSKPARAAATGAQRKPKAKPVGAKPAARRLDEAAKAAFRQELVAIARALFVADGFDSVSMRAIAARAACSPMALYKYFPNKLALLRYIWADIFGELFAQTEAALDAQTDTLGKLRAYWLTWANYWLDHPDNYRVVFMNQDTPAEVPLPHVQGMDGQFFANSEQTQAHLFKVVEVFMQGMAEGVLREMPPELCIQIFLAHLLGLTHGVITVPEFEWAPREALLAEAVEVTLQGFARIR
jgi:AcrR family transcriptional regulator